MKDTMYMPCTEWAEKLAATRPGDLSHVEQQDLNTHIASCDACAAVRLEYQAMSSFIYNIPAPPLRPGFPSHLSQLGEDQEDYGSVSQRTFAEKKRGISKPSKVHVKSKIGSLIPDLLRAASAIHLEQKVADRKEFVHRYEEIGRLILVIAFSLLALGLLVGFFVTRDPILLATDTLPGAGLATILPHYFNKK